LSLLKFGEGALGCRGGLQSCLLLQNSQIEISVPGFIFWLGVFVIFLSTEQSRYTDSQLFEFNVKFLIVIFPVTYFNYASGNKEIINFLSFADNDIRPLYLPIAFISTTISYHITYTNNKLPYYTISYHITHTPSSVHTRRISYFHTLESCQA